MERILDGHKWPPTGRSAGLMPRARWLFGCNDIAAYKTNGANGVNGFDGRNGENGRCGVYGRDGRIWLIDSWLGWGEGLEL